MVKTIWWMNHEHVEVRNKRHEEEIKCDMGLFTIEPNRRSSMRTKTLTELDYFSRSESAGIIYAWHHCGAYQHETQSKHSLPVHIQQTSSTVRMKCTPKYWGSPSGWHAGALFTLNQVNLVLPQVTHDAVILQPDVDVGRHGKARGGAINGALLELAGAFPPCIAQAHDVVQRAAAQAERDGGTAMALDWRDDPLAPRCVACLDEERRTGQTSVFRATYLYQYTMQSQYHKQSTSSKDLRKAGLTSNPSLTLFSMLPDSKYSTIVLSLCLIWYLAGNGPW